MADVRQDSLPNGPWWASQAVPTCYVRAWLYAIVWLPPLIFLSYVVPRFDPILEKLDELRGLPQLVSWVWAFARVNEAYFCLPAVLHVMMLIAITELIMVVARQSRLGWATVVACTGLLAWFMVIKLLTILFGRY